MTGVPDETKDAKSRKRGKGSKNKRRGRISKR